MFRTTHTLTALTIFCGLLLSTLSGTAVADERPLIDAFQETETKAKTVLSSQNASPFSLGNLSVSHTAPKATGETGAAFYAEGRTQNEALQRLAAKLSKVGFRNFRAHPWFGTISGRTEAIQLLDCGTVIVTADSISTPFDARTALSVVPFSTGRDTAFAQREFKPNSRYRIIVRKAANAVGYVARIKEVHVAQVALKSLNRERTLKSDSARFEGNQIGKLNTGTSCVSAGFLRRVLQ